MWKCPDLSQDEAARSIQPQLELHKSTIERELALQVLRPPVSVASFAGSGGRMV
jgi:hypothetical protein